MPGVVLRVSSTLQSRPSSSAWYRAVVVAIPQENTTLPMETKEQLIDRLLDLAFAEDIGDGDHTTLSTIPATATGRQHLLVKEDGIIAGVEIAGKVFNRLDPALKMEVLIADGTPVRKGDVAFVVEGPVRSLLIGHGCP